MKILKIKNKDEIKKLNLPNNVMTAGFFDGIHLGHQMLIKKAKKASESRKIPLVVLTFWPYPKQFYTSIKTPYPILTTQEDKANIFKKMGVDIVLEVEFNLEIQKMDPQEFVNHYIRAAHTSLFIAGLDFTYGKKDIANMDLLPSYSNGDFCVEKFPFACIGGQKVSSSKIRQEIEQNQLGIADKLLGRNYLTKGKVITGEQIGRTLGFPTANVDNSANYLMPSDGVYFTKVTIKNQSYWGITSVGNKPTYEGKKQFVETYILDFDQDIYGETLEINWLKFDRFQVKFNSVKELTNEIANDELKMRRYIKNK